MFDEPFRRILPALVGAPVRGMARLGVTPNQVTVTACVLGCAAAALVARGAAWTGILLWLASRVLDGMDGILARVTQRKSRFGGYLDITLDMLAYSVMLLGFWISAPQAGWAWPAILMGYVLVTTSTLALSSILEQQRADIATGATPEGNRTIRFTPGLAEAGETSVVYVLFTVLPDYITIIAWVWAAMCAATVVQRTLLARRILTDD